MNYQYPDNLKYTEDHEWILEKEGRDCWDYRLCPTFFGDLVLWNYLNSGKK